MAKNRKNQAAEIRFGPVLKVVLLCLLIGGSAIGYVWQKNQINKLGKQISDLENKLRQAKQDNKYLSDQVAILNSPVMIDRKVRELKLGLAPAQPLQVVRLVDPPAPVPEGPRELAERPAPGGSP
ncbi:MAG TPA: septum formation initiator family protein [Candidatus Acidoferrales bacterium]|nr:septum formation initiator family protein [Candidatus Acidoferrales bacterium]